MQCRFCSSPTITRHKSRSREAFYIWLYAGLQDTMLAVLSRVLSWYVSQSYLLLDIFFFLSLKKKSLLLFAINCCDMSVEFQCFNGSHFQAQCALFSAVTIFHYVIFFVRVVKFTQFVFFTLGFSVFTFSAETLHPLSKNLYILNSLSIYQCVSVDVFTSTPTVWWRFSVVCCA